LAFPPKKKVVVVQVGGGVQEVFQGDVAGRARYPVGGPNIRQHFLAARGRQNQEARPGTGQATARYQAADQDVGADGWSSEAEGSYRPLGSGKQVLDDQNATRVRGFDDLIRADRCQEQLEQQLFFPNA
jgi:hypothetical protein